MIQIHNIEVSVVGYPPEMKEQSLPSSLEIEANSDWTINDFVFEILFLTGCRPRPFQENYEETFELIAGKDSQVPIDEKTLKECGLVSGTKVKLIWKAKKSVTPKEEPEVCLFISYHFN